MEKANHQDCIHQNTAVNLMARIPLPDLVRLFAVGGGIVLENNHLHIDNPLFAEESCRHVAHRSPVVQYSLHVPVTTPADMNKYSFRTAT